MPNDIDANTFTVESQIPGLPVMRIWTHHTNRPIMPEARKIFTRDMKSLLAGYPSIFL